MPGFLKKLSRFPIALFRFLKIRRAAPPEEPGETDELLIEEKWIAPFGRRGRIRFDIKSENFHDAYIPGGRSSSRYPNALVLGLKKAHYLGWVDAPGCRYGDMVLEARFSLNPCGGYAAAGFMFRVMDGGTHYLVLVSSKGYFRLDVVRNGMPHPLIGWTELPAPPEPGAGGETPPPPLSTALLLIAYGSHILLAINGSWAAEVNDSSLSSGEICFAAASYGKEGPAGPESPGPAGDSGAAYTAEAALEFLSVDTRTGEVAALYEKWSGKGGEPQSHLRLAETFAAMDQPEAALIQVKQAWEYPGRGRKAEELLFAGRLALALARFAEAEEYVTACIAAARPLPEAGPLEEAGPLVEAARIERAKILYGEKRFGDLAAYTAEALILLPGEPVLQVLRAHALRNLGEYEKAAGAYDRAFELDGKDSSSLRDAALMYEALGKGEAALERGLRAGSLFLGEENYGELGDLIPRLLSLGENNWEVHGLAGKWAFGIEDWKRAEEEFVRSEQLRKKARPRPSRDGAAVFLQGLLRIQGGKRQEALPLLEAAAALAPDFPLFRFRLAETRYLLSGDAGDPRVRVDLEAALALAPEDGWIHNFAAQLALDRGDLTAAGDHLALARKALGEIAAVSINQAVLYSLQGDLDGALALLDSETDKEDRGARANCAGNLLARAGRYGEAEERCRKALAQDPDNREYLCSLASCLIETGQYGGADEILLQAHAGGPDTAVLELISFVAARKGEYARAESACKAALELDPRHIPSLLTLGQYYLSKDRLDEADEILRRLEEMPLAEEAADHREEIRRRLKEARTRIIPCGACGRTWQVPRSPPPAPPIRLFAMPPDDLPAGTCTNCGITYCIGCGKNHLDQNGRFVCPACKKNLRLINEGLKQMVYDWSAAQELSVKKKKRKN